MAKQLINEIQIKAAIVPKLRKAARYVADELYKRNKELVESIVYASYTPTEYVRSGQFKEAWETKDYTMANNNALQAAVVADLKNVVDYVVQKLWEENRDLIQKIVYDGYQPEEYERTNEFKEAWNTEVKTLNNFVQGEFKYDSRLLTVDTDNGQHSSLVDGPPMTEYLAEVIYEGLSGAIHEPRYGPD